MKQIGDYWTETEFDCAHVVQSGNEEWRIGNAINSQGEPCIVIWANNLVAVWLPAVHVDLLVRAALDAQTSADYMQFQRAEAQKQILVDSRPS